MNDLPKVSVIIPVYNQEAVVSEAIASVLVDPHENTEVLVVNDGSTDASEAEIKKFASSESEQYDPRVRYFSQTNQGKSAAVNYVLRHCTGEYINILDGDDRLAQESLSSRLAVAGRNPERRPELIIGGFTVFFRNQTLGVRLPPATTDPAALRRAFMWSYKTPFSLNNCLIHRDLVERTGFFSEDLRRCQDIDYALRLLDRCRSVAVVERPVYEYRKHRQTIAQRLRIRFQTMIFRSKAFTRNLEGGLKYLLAGYGLLLDAGKAAYELFKPYTH